MPISRKDMDMQRAGEDLAAILEKQIKNYEDLKHHILEKRKAIIANDLKRLSEITSRIENLIGSNNQLEIGRMGLVKRLAGEMKLSGPKPTLREIARRFGGTLSGKLMDLRRRVISAIKDVQRQNQMNGEMLRYSADLMDSVLKHLVEPEPHEITYGNGGKAKRRALSASLLDRHA